MGKQEEITPPILPPTKIVIRDLGLELRYDQPAL